MARRRAMRQKIVSVFRKDREPLRQIVVSYVMALLEDGTMATKPVLTLRNQLLNSMNTACRARIDPYLERIEMEQGDVVCEARGALKYAYFPDGAILSLLAVLENGVTIETALIGREGAFGLFAAMYNRVSF